ncbi:MAG TPA: hypothetical protein VMO47_10810 [Rhodothermales bacterium]|nr:hypothetical protein [Rhodothermales bacterium]
MIKSLGQFAAAVSAPRKWVLNAHAVLGLDLEYSVERAKTLSISRLLETEWSIPLKKAFDLAQQILLLQSDKPAWRIVSPDGLSTLSIDRERVLSDFAVRLSFALVGYAQRRSGRPRKNEGTGVAAAMEHGVDVSLLESSLESTPAERLRRLDENATFVSKLRVVRP